MNNNILKIAIHRLAEHLRSVDSLYYNLGDINKSEQIVFYIVNDLPDGRDTMNDYATIKVQFNVFSKTDDNGDTCDDMAAELESVMTKENIVFDDESEVINVKREFIIPSKKIEDVWQSSIQYSIHVKKA